MTHRERLMAALNHREPDRVPMDLGAARFTGMVKGAYDRLCAHLGFGEPGVMIDRMQQLVTIDEAVQRYLDVDARAVALGAPDRDGEIELAPDHYRDEWGVERVQPPGCVYYDMVASPLSGEIDTAAIASYRWPDPTDPGRYRGLKERALALHRDTDYAVVYNARYHLVHQTQYLRGFEDWYMDLAGNQERFHALMEAVLEILIELNRPALEALGDIVDVVSFGDDIGLQDRPVCSLPLYRKMILPYQQRIVAAIRKHTQAKILYHTCGSVYAYIPDFIDIGIDALNPVQVSARHMDPERLKREFGGRMTFWGGIDSQRLLPYGTPGEVREGTRRMIETMGAGGGYVLAAVHNIQPDVSPENLLAMFEEAKRPVRFPETSVAD